MTSAISLQIVAASNIAAGAEVHNTYGELGNAELVYKYGFALRCAVAPGEKLWWWVG